MNYATANDTLCVTIHVIFKKNKILTLFSGHRPSNVCLEIIYSIVTDIFIHLYYCGDIEINFYQENSIVYGPSKQILMQFIAEFIVTVNFIDLNASFQKFPAC